MEAPTVCCPSGFPTDVFVDLKLYIKAQDEEPTWKSLAKKCLVDSSETVAQRQWILYWCCWKSRWKFIFRASIPSIDSCRNDTMPCVSNFQLQETPLVHLPVTNVGTVFGPKFYRFRALFASEWATHFSQRVGSIEDGLPQRVWGLSHHKSQRWSQLTILWENLPDVGSRRKKSCFCWFYILLLTTIRNSMDFTGLLRRWQDMSTTTS